MAQIDIDLLSNVIDRYVAERSVHLSPGERVEVVRIAQGHACKRSAELAGVSYETVRARRKRIYRKLGLDGATEVTSSLLGLALTMLSGSEERRASMAPVELAAASRTGVAPPLS